MNNEEPTEIWLTTNNPQLKGPVVVVAGGFVSTDHRPPSQVPSLGSKTCDLLELSCKVGSFVGSQRGKPHGEAISVLRLTPPTSDP